MRPLLEQLEDRCLPSSYYYDRAPNAFVLGYPPLNVRAGSTVYYSVDTTVPAEGMNAAEVEGATALALGEWAKYIPLNFVEVPPDQSPGTPYVPISIGPIDGDLGILGITYAFGTARSITVDSDGPWTTDPAFATDLAPPVWMAKVIMHEWGHVLGLGHQEDPTVPAIMRPTYRSSPGTIVADDIAGAQSIYGTGLGSVTPLPAVPRGVPAISVGAFDPATDLWHLSGSRPDPVWFGHVGDTPVVGDWDGDGIDTIGAVDPTTATWYLKNANIQGAPDINPFAYGAPGWLPLAGDWDGDHKASPGTFDPATATWYLRNSSSAGAPSVAPFRFGAAGWKPLAGDWDGTGWAKPAVYDPVTGIVYEAVVGGVRRVQGQAGAAPVAGAWDTGARALIGFVLNAHWRLLFPTGPVEFFYGTVGCVPITGRWAT